jgi:hypothetical protein
MPRKRWREDVFSQGQLEHKCVPHRTDARIRRTLDGVRQNLVELSRPHVVVRFLSNADQKGEIVGLVEDIREAIINYQVLCKPLDGTCPELTTTIDVPTERFVRNEL